jgi:hypothetical protein
MMLGNPEFMVSTAQENKVVPGKTPADGRNRLIVLVTPTIVDPVGNRAHSEDEMPFARDSIPPEPPH